MQRWVRNSVSAVSGRQTVMQLKARFIAQQLNSTQLDVELRCIELLRYKRGLKRCCVAERRWNRKLVSNLARNLRNPPVKIIAGWEQTRWRRQGSQTTIGSKTYYRSSMYPYFVTLREAATSAAAHVSRAAPFTSFWSGQGTNHSGVPAYNDLTFSHTTRVGLFIIRLLLLLVLVLVLGLKTKS